MIAHTKIPGVTIKEQEEQYEAGLIKENEYYKNAGTIWRDWPSMWPYKGMLTHKRVPFSNSMPQPTPPESTVKPDEKPGDIIMRAGGVPLAAATAKKSGKGVVLKVGEQKTKYVRQDDLDKK